MAVNNLPDEIEKYVVTRLVSGELWFYGSYESESQATEIAKILDGLVVERV